MTDIFELDTSKLTGDNNDKIQLYIFQWLATIEGELQISNDIPDGLVKDLMSFLPLKPGRPIRHLIARNLVFIFRKETKHLFETVTSLNNCLLNPRLEKEYRLAALQVLGYIMEHVGDQVITVFNDSLNTLTRILKGSQLLAIRCETLGTLCKLIKGCSRAVNDSVAKDLLKFLKPFVSDKAHIVQKLAINCLHALLPAFQTTEIDFLITLLLKTLDGSSRIVRIAIASLFGEILANQIDKSEDSKESTSADEVLQRLSNVYNSKSSTPIVRTGIAETYSYLFKCLGTSYIESHYGIISQHLLNRIASQSWLHTDRHEALRARGHVRVLLRQVIGSRLLSEQGQIAAIKELVNNVVKLWPPVMPGSVAPSKLALVCAVEEIAGLLTELGGAGISVQDVGIDPIVKLLAHPSWSVQVSTAWCLRCLAVAVPSQLSNLIKTVMALVSNDMSKLGISGAPTDISRRAIGHAHGLAVLMSVVKIHPLHVSFDLCTNVFSMSASLLKASGDKDLRYSGVQIQVAWTLISPLMALGPNFVRLHLPQLLLLWKTALPRPLGKDTQRNDSDWAFLIHVRECCLSSILAFLRHNGKSTLMTTDVARRLVALLNNTFAFLNIVSAHIPHINEHHDEGEKSKPSLRLIDRDLMLRRRVFQCFDQLATHSACEPLYSNLLDSCVALFADPERYTGSSVSAAIAASSGPFTNLWTMTDEYAYGVTSLMRRMRITLEEEKHDSRLLSIDITESAIEDQLEQPIMGAIEHDTLCIQSNDLELAPPAATALVDATIILFSQLFPLQSSHQQEHLLENLINSVRSSKLDKNPGRKMAVLVNAVVALLGTLRRMQGSKTGIKDKRVGAIAQELLQEGILHHDPFVRSAAAEALGRLASFCGMLTMSYQIQILVDQVVNNRDSNARAGCALALGNIYRYVGGMAAGSTHLKTIVGILTSLCSDPHPTVHFWSLNALALVIDAAGLSFANYVNATLATIAKLYNTDTHEPTAGGSNVIVSNIAAEVSVYQMFGKIIDAIIGVVGPEVAISSKLQDMLLHLIRELMHETDIGVVVVVEGTRCLQHLIMFAPNVIPWQKLVHDLQGFLVQDVVPLKTVAVNTLYQLVQRDAAGVFKAAASTTVNRREKSLGEMLFALLDTDPYLDGVRDIILSWLKQTATDSPLAWVELCRRIMTRTGSGKKQQALEVNESDPNVLEDEEVESFAAQTAVHDNKITSRWRTQSFALRCLNEVIISSGRRALNNRPLTSRISELIRMSFAASTATIDELRLEGLEILKNVIEAFATIPDPDFEEAMILEQYQAQIGAALTPAFGADSSPIILAHAVQVCANFVGSGIVKELSGMGRILKLLTNALESCQTSDMTSLGEVKNLSPHAAIMIKMSVLEAWAELQVASTKRNYLVKVVDPHLQYLCPLWLMSLRDYARLKVEPDGEDSAFDSAYAGLTREVVMPFYDQCWIGILNAVTVLVDDPLMRKALAGDTTPSSSPKTNEPVAFFFALYGLCFESITRVPSGATSSKDLQLLRVCIEAIRKLMVPEIAGNVPLDDANFEDLISLFDRLVLAEGPEIQRLVIHAVKSIVASYGKLFMAGSDLKVDNKVYRLLAIVTSTLQRHVPKLGRQLPSKRSRDGQLIATGVETFSFITKMFPEKLQSHFFAIELYIYSCVISDEHFQEDVPILFPGFKQLLAEKLVSHSNKENIRILHGFVLTLMQNMDNVRGRESITAEMVVQNNIIVGALVFSAMLNANVDVDAEIYRDFGRSVTVNLQMSMPRASAASISAMKTLMSSKKMQVITIKMLIPDLVTFVQAQRAIVGELKERMVDPRAQILDEAIKTLIGSLEIVKFLCKREEDLISYTALVLQTLVHLLDAGRPLNGTSLLHDLTIPHLVSMATSQSQLFKDCVSTLNPTQRETLQAAIRHKVGMGAEQSKAAIAPTISLKTFA